MRRNLIWAGAIALSMLISGHAQADIVIGFSNAAGGTGMDLDAIQADGLNLQVQDFPFTTSVVEDLTGVLEITLVSGSSTDNDVTNRINAGGNGLGFNSNNDASSTRFDAAEEEQLFISFNRDIFIEFAELVSLGNSDVFTIGSVTGITDALSNADIFDFTAGGTTDGLFLPAGQSLLLEATTGSVGLASLEVTIATSVVPEPSSLLGLIGLAGLFAVKRRRKSTTVMHITSRDELNHWTLVV